jgi:hypothetical protein
MMPAGRSDEPLRVRISDRDEPVRDWRAHDLVIRAVGCRAITTSQVPDVVQECERDPPPRVPPPERVKPLQRFHRGLSASEQAEVRSAGKTYTGDGSKVRWH